MAVADSCGDGPRAGPRGMRPLPVPLAAEARPGPGAALPQPLAPLPGYQVLEVAIQPGSPAAGRKVGASRGHLATSRSRSSAAACCATPTPAPSWPRGDRISLLAPAPAPPAPAPPAPAPARPRNEPDR
jgi:hypothetical protein